MAHTFINGHGDALRSLTVARIPGVRWILSRDDAREVFGRRDGDAVWDAFGRAPQVFIAAVHEALPAAAPVVPASIAPHATTHGAAIPPEALVADMLPCPFCRSTQLVVGPAGSQFPRVTCGECGTRGPIARSIENREAIANWNRRPGSHTVPVYDGFGGPKIGEATVDGCTVIAKITDARAAEVLRASTGPRSVSMGYRVVVEPEPAEPTE